MEDEKLEKAKKKQRKLSTSMDVPPPRLADPASTTKVSWMSPIGRSLEQAIQSFEKIYAPVEEGDDDTIVSVQESSIENDNNIYTMDEHISKRIRHSYEEAVTNTQWYSKDGSFSLDSTNTSKVSPPAALLKGKIKHYNRFGAHWKIVLEEDAKLLPRPNLVPTTDVSRFSKIRTLWDDCTENPDSNSDKTTSNNSIGLANLEDQNDMGKLTHTKMKSETICIPERLEILAFDDL